MECVLCKRVGSSLPAEFKEEDFLLCEGLTTNVFVLKRDTNSGGLVLQTAPDADVLLVVARRAILDAFPSKTDDVEDKGKDSAKNCIRLSLSHPLWSDRASWIALFTVNCVVGCDILPRNRQRVYRRRTHVSSTSKRRRRRRRRRRKRKNARTRLALPKRLLFSSSSSSSFFFFSVVLLPLSRSTCSNEASFCAQEIVVSRSSGSMSSL